MRWLGKPVPAHGDLRVIERFAWVPTLIGWNHDNGDSPKYCWLESYLVLQRYSGEHRYDDNPGWLSKRRAPVPNQCVDISPTNTHFWNLDKEPLDA
jgi:hypothetical protein